MELTITTVFLYIFAAFAAYAAYCRIVYHRLNYWKIRGILHDEPSLIVGNMKGASITRHLIEPIRDLYNKYKTTGPFCGLYYFWSPAVLVLELDLVKKILIQDFNNFDDRGIFFNDRDDPLSANLFALDGTKWRQLRNKLSSTFTSGKMKFMFPTVVEVGHRFVEAFGEEIDKQSDVIEINDVSARFTTDVIGACAFGVECNSLKDPNAQFRSYGRRISEKRYSKVIVNFMHSCPRLARFLRMKVTASDIENFFMNVVKETVTYREENNIRRNDFMDMMIDFKNRKPFTTEDGEVVHGLTMEEVAAQAFIFYSAGFETTSLTISYAMFELAKNPDIQEKVRTEVNAVLAKYNQEITYESLGEMNYLGQVIDETLRMYTIIPFLHRRAKEDYDTGVPKYKIEKGTVVFIPLDSIHNDPNIFPNPTQFNPDRFTPEEIQKRESCAFLPFGGGPRNCIGLRFGKMQTKIGLGLIFKNFKLTICDRTQIPLVFDPKEYLQHVLHGIYLKASKL